MKSGFTLIELSIVLVIVGLLISGILIGQSLIETAKLLRQVKQIEQYDIAVSNFKAAYKALPGDSTAIHLNYTNIYGNGNGIINENCGGCFHDNSEIANFWYQLSKMKFMNDGVIYSQHIGQSDVAIKPGIDIPKSSWNPQAGIIAYGVIADNKNYYDISKPKRGDFLYEPGASFNTKQAVALDKKLDDGFPNTGKVIARNSAPTLSTGFSGSSTGASASCVSGNVYNMTSSSLACIPRIEILSQLKN